MCILCKVDILKKWALRHSLLFSLWCYVLRFLHNHNLCYFSMFCISYLFSLSLSLSLCIYVWFVYWKNEHFIVVCSFLHDVTFCVSHTILILLFLFFFCSLCISVIWERDRIDNWTEWLKDLCTCVGIVSLTSTGYQWSLVIPMVGTSKMMHQRLRVSPMALGGKDYAV